MTKVKQEVVKSGRRGRKALEGVELNVPGLRSVLAGKEITPYYKQKLAEQGLIRLVSFKEPGTRGRPTFIPVITDKGFAYYEKNAENVKGFLISETRNQEQRSETRNQEQRAA